MCKFLRHLLLTLGFLMSLIALPALAEERSENLCNLPRNCAAYRGAVQTLAVSESQMHRLILGDRDFSSPLSPQRCWHLGQEIYLYSLDSQKVATHAGRGRLTRLEGSSDAPNGQIFVEEFSPSAQLLAPECYGYCEAVLFNLPSLDGGGSMIDLRSSSQAGSAPIPGSQNIPFLPNQNPIQFNTAKLPAKNLPLYFISGDAKKDNANLPRLFQTLWEKGWKRIVWIYPGYWGISETPLPVKKPEELRELTPLQMKGMAAADVSFFYVGPPRGFRPFQLFGIPLLDASYKPVPRQKAARNPFENRLSPANFSLPRKMPPASQTLILIEDDAAYGLRFRAAEALRTLGFQRIFVMQTGLNQLRELPKSEVQ